METTEIEGAAPRRAVRGLSLLSGGLDSQLAICVLRAQGIEMEAVVFRSPFFDISSATKASQALGVRLHTVDFTGDIVGLVKHPPHGFGSGMNPCLDCHAQMLARAGELMRREGFDFVSTGEVVGQRPMSQHRRGLDLVAKVSGIRESILRPLSALRLEPTPMELDGRVDRTRLLGLEGRSRKPQMALAREYGVVDYPSPAGGCKLTEPNYARRLRDLRKNEGLEDVLLIDLLRLGRHVRLPGGGRAIVGRNKADNEAIRTSVREGDVIVRTAEVPGPSVLVLRGSSDSDVVLAMGICAHYADHGDATSVRVRLFRTGANPEEKMVAPLARDNFDGWML